MATELEQEIMKEIGLDQEWSWYQGSRDCIWIRKRAIDALSGALEKRGMKLADRWGETIREADAADTLRDHGVSGGNEGTSLVNVWKTISYAIQDAMYRKENGEEKGINPKMDFEFYDKETKDLWNSMMDERGERMKEGKNL